MSPDRQWCDLCGKSHAQHDWTWRERADHTLAGLYANGHQPTKAEIHNAYPFGPRAWTPYKVWLQQVQWWQAGHPAYVTITGKPDKRYGHRPVPVPPEQAALL